MKINEIENIINEIINFLYMNDINTYQLYSNKNNINDFINFDIIEYFGLNCSNPHKINNLLANFKNIDISFIDYLIEFIEKIIINYEDIINEINYISNLEIKKEDIYNYNKIFDENAKITSFEYDDYYFIKLLFNLLINKSIRYKIINNILKDKEINNNSLLNYDYIKEILNYKINNKINVLLNKLKHYSYYNNEILPKKKTFIIQ